VAATSSVRITSTSLVMILHRSFVCESSRTRPFCVRLRSAASGCERLYAAANSSDGPCQLLQLFHGKGSPVLRQKWHHGSNSCGGRESLQSTVLQVLMSVRP